MSLYDLWEATHTHDIALDRRHKLANKAKQIKLSFTMNGKECVCECISDVVLREWFFVVIVWVGAQ